ncbi:MAG TPA: helix-turn-helix domain-containing protein [Candidatus Dormibacteraeota bacterium]|nr:helix-turn-helix domain-containing protein [Candidatus Dormibacteraeota bacterium]
MAPAARSGAARERELRELLYLQKLAVEAASTMERDELFSLVLRETTGVLEADVCSLYLQDRVRGGLVLTATNGLNQAAVGSVVLSAGQGITGAVAKLREPLSVAEVATDPHFEWIDGLDEERFTSMLSVPILAGPRMVGVLNVQTVKRREFRTDELAVLSAIAGALAGVLERSELQHRLELQLVEIQLSQTVHERFTGLALSGAGLPKILDAIAALAGGEVGLYDPLGFHLEHGAGRGLAARRLAIPTALIGPAAAGPVGLSLSRPRLDLILTPVRAGEELVAVLAVEGTVATAGAGTRRALEHGATVVALELLKERAAAEVERRLRGDLLEGLLTAGQSPDDIARLAVRAERLGYRIPDSAWVLVLEPDDERTLAKFQTQPLQERLQRDLNELTQRRFPGSLVVARATYTVLLIPAQAAAARGGLAQPNPAGLEEFARAILALAQGLGRRLLFSAGMGNLAASALELARAHEEARQALRLSRRAGGVGQVTSYRSLGALRLLLEVRDPDVLRRFVDETLGPILGYALRHRTPLLATLEALVSQRWNQRAAARQLHVHINTLAYRVQRIEDLLSASLDDAETRVVLSVALQARQLYSG